MTTQVLIALGSNLGDRLANLRAGVAALSAHDGVEIVDVSRLFETAPVGGPDGQGPYLNAALTATTTVPAGELLAVLHRIETTQERERAVRWGPRTLDLDLLVYGELVSHDPSMRVPHPRLHERRFVLAPVCDVAPDLVHPELGRPMRDLLDDLTAEPGDLTPIADHWHCTTEDPT